MIRISEPDLGPEEKKAINQVLDSGFLIQGKIVNIFERKFAALIGTKYAVATSSGTTALHLALLSLGISKGDEVITSPFSFISTSNAILFTGAKPVFADIEESSFNINPELIEQKISKKTKAILPVHLFGLPANMNKILSISKKYNLKVIEDACQSHGASIKGKNVGSFGHVGCFSFYPTKNVTTGEGGMVTTNDRILAKKIISLRNHGMRTKHKHDILGYNFRLTNLAASIGVAQLNKLTYLNSKRIYNANFYNTHLAEIKGLLIPNQWKDYKHVFNQYILRIRPSYKFTRKKLIKNLRKNNIETQIYYPKPIHKQKIYQNLMYLDRLPASERLSKEVLSIPVHPLLEKKELNKIINIIN